MRLLSLDDPRWFDFVESRREASLFHHPVWTGLLADCYGFKPMALALDERGDVTAGVPLLDVTRPLGGRRWVSLPFTDYCTPLAGERPRDFVDGLVEAARSRKLDMLEVRGPLSLHPGVQRDAAFVLHDVSLAEGGDAAWDRLYKNHRRNVRIAERADVRIAQSTSGPDLEAFYRLHLQTRRRLGVPIQPRRFFRLLLERILQRGLGFMLIARRDDVPIAAAVFGAWNGTLIYKYSARDERFAKLNANYLLLWSAIRWAADNGYHTVDLGRSDLEQTQLRGFKDGWGARETVLPYSRIATTTIKLSSRRMEGTMAKVIRNSAPWVCRAVGELFYKYAA